MDAENKTALTKGVLKIVFLLFPAWILWVVYHHDIRNFFHEATGVRINDVIWVFVTLMFCLISARLVVGRELKVIFDRHDGNS